MTPHRILLIDDEPFVLRALQRQLRSLDASLSISSFSDPFRALANARECSYALAIADYRMPGMNGVELLARLRLLQPHCERVILSGHTDQLGLLGAINEAQIARFLIKPWDEQELLDTVQQLAWRRAQALEDSRLADQQRLQQGQVSAQELERRRLELQEPGITHVERDADGAFILG